MSAQFDQREPQAYDRRMETHIHKLESELVALKTDVAIIKSNYATRADVADAKNSVIIWVVSAVLLAQLLPALLKAFS